MQEFWKAVIQFIQEGNYIAIIMVISAVILFNVAKISKFLEEKKLSRKSNLDSFKLDSFNDESYKNITQFLNEQRIKEYFYLATDLNLDVIDINKLINFYDKVKNKFSFFTVKRAISYLKFDSAEISIELTSWQRVGYWFNNFAIIFLMLSGLLLFVSVPILGLESIFQIIVIGLIGLVLLLIALFIWIELSLPFHWAWMLNEEIKQQAQQQEVQQQEVQQEQ